MTRKCQRTDSNPLPMSLPAICLFLALMLAVAPPVSAQTVPQTGQQTCYDANGKVISCSGTNQDGDLRMGVAWPEPRFHAHGDGTVLDALTGLIWLQDADCAATGRPGGTVTWSVALSVVGRLKSGDCGLTDNSSAGAWRLPNANELQSLLDYEFTGPAVSDAAGSGQWTEGNAFKNLMAGDATAFWSSTSNVAGPTEAFTLNPSYSVIGQQKTSKLRLLPVRGTTSGPAPVWQTGQESCYSSTGSLVPCGGSGQDGSLRDGVAFPKPRFHDLGDGTIVDHLTGLAWLKDANCSTFGTDGTYWTTALSSAAALKNGDCGLSDGSVAGDWRLPNVNELLSLINFDYHDPSLSNAAGTKQATYSSPFTGLQDFPGYWTSTTYVETPSTAWYVVFLAGGGTGLDAKSPPSKGGYTNKYHVLPVKGGS